MKPDIQWQFSDDPDQPDIRTPAPASRHWRPRVIGLMVALGVGLGAAYASIPEPPARPQPTPRPVADLPVDLDIPVATLSPQQRSTALQAVIEHEAQALASGDVLALAAVQDRADDYWREAQLQTLSPWGGPPDAGLRPLYLFTVGGNPARTDRVWVEVSQRRDGGVFRETRFYRLRGAEWRRTRPPADFWRGPARTFTSTHFTLDLPQADSDFAPAILNRFEAVLSHVCADLACATAAITPAIQLVVVPEYGHAGGVELGDEPLITIGSPRVLGLLDTGVAIERRDPITGLALRWLPELLARSIAGSREPWTPDRGGTLFVSAVAQWAGWRASATDRAELIRREVLNGQPLTSPQYLWDWSMRDGRNLRRPQTSANSVVVFIEERFGPEAVPAFLAAIGGARSLAAAVESSWPIAYADFEQQWRHWLEDQLKE